MCAFLSFTSNRLTPLAEYLSPFGGRSQNFVVIYKPYIKGSSYTFYALGLQI